MALADAQDALVALVGGAAGVEARLGPPADVPPGRSAWVELAYREEAEILDGAATVERRAATLTAVVLESAVLPAGASPAPVRDALAAVVAAVRAALAADRSLGGAVALARLARVTVEEAWGEGGRLQLAARLEVEVTGYSA